MRRRRRMLQELDEDIRDHIERETQDNIDRGMTPEEARLAAVRKFGNVTRVKEDTREVWTIVWLEQFLQDIGYGLRILRRSPAFTAVAVLTLAMGIGANTAIFSEINGILLRPLPYEKPEQLLAMDQNDSLVNVIERERETRAFDRIGAINTELMDYTGGPEPVQVHAGYVDAGFLETLGVPPMLGRLLSREEDVSSGPRVAVVSFSFWRDFLNSDPHVLGKTIPLSGVSYSVVGVMPKSFTLPRERADLFVSLWVAYPEAAPVRSVHFMHVYGRLKPGSTPSQAQAEIDAADHRLAQLYPASEKGRKTKVVPLHVWVTGGVATPLLVLFGAVGLVLLIACANFAGLLMARAVARRKEWEIRAALGAGRERLIRQAATESVLLSLIGGGVGLLLARWGTSALGSLRPAALERFGGIPMDGRVLFFVFGLSILTGVLFGLAPAWSSRADVAEALKESGRSTTANASTLRLRRILVISELALALVLSVGAGLLIRGFSRLRSVHPGFNPSHVVTMALQLPSTRYAEISAQTQFRREVLSRLNSLPDAQAAMISDLPLSGGYVSHSIVIAGHPTMVVGEEPSVQTLCVMGDYFRVMEIPIRAGRPFTPMDREGQPLVAVVNEEFVRKFLSRENPIGARIDWPRRDSPPKWMTIVGVASDVKHSGLNQPVDPAVYAPFSQSDEAWRRWMTIAIRTRGTAPWVAAEAKKAIWSVDPKVPVSDVQSMEEVLATSLAERRFDMLLLALFAALALALAGVGIYGLMAYAVGQRRQEIGIRLALGARHRDVVWLLVGEGAKLALAGTVIGVVGALGLTRLMTSLLFEIRPTDPQTFAGTAILLVAMALAASYIPARRAIRVGPAESLR